MKLKKIIDLCKKAGAFYLFEDEVNECQWLSDGFACYPLYGVPRLDEDTLCTLFDISDKAREKLVFRHEYSLPKRLCFADAMPGEARCEEYPMLLGEGKNGVMPYKTSQGVQFLACKHVAPFDGESGGMLEVWERTAGDGHVYFAVKSGLLLVGIVEPYDVINESFVESLGSLFAMCEVALQNKKLAEEEQMRIEEDE